MFERFFSSVKDGTVKVLNIFSVQHDKLEKVSDVGFLNETAVNYPFSDYNISPSVMLPDVVIKNNPPSYFYCEESPNDPDYKIDWVDCEVYESGSEDEDSIVSRFSQVIRLDGDHDSLRRRNDREEIRRRLATGDSDDYPHSDRPGRKPSLQSRLQSGMNLQICFMNDAMSDTESPGSDGSPMSMPPPVKPKIHQDTQPRSLVITSQKPQNTVRNRGDGMEGDFFSRQARLQAEARMALAQAKDLARVQMQQERRKYQTSPITDMLRTSLRKVGVELAEGRRRVSRQLLTDMNVAQLQVIVNDLHSQIEVLNEGLVKYLMERDELHMGQDSMLVDIEDLTRYLGAKENLIKEELAQNNINQNNNNISPGGKPVITRIVNLTKK